MRPREGVSWIGAVFAILCAGGFGLASVGEAADEKAPAPAPASPAAAYRIPWQSMTDGGGRSQIGNRVLDGSVGLPAVGSSANSGFLIGGGYWPGVTICDCGVWGDVSNDGHVNPIDVVRMVNFVYKGQTSALTRPADFVCPRPLGDISCDGAVNPIDVVRYVNFVYKGQSNAFCANPCA